MSVDSVLDIPVEICVHSLDTESVKRSVASSIKGGAVRIELCADMSVGGTTPAPTHVEAAKVAMGECDGLLCMVRPRGGDFFYSPQEINRMESDIIDVAAAGADGVVFGVLQREGCCTDQEATARLVDRARSLNLSVTVHRAFDALAEPLVDLDFYAGIGVDRILSSGTAWDSLQGAVDGTERLSALVGKVGKQIELVIGGGVSPENCTGILSALSVADDDRVSVHAYSSVLEAGEVSVERVRQLCVAVSSAESRVAETVASESA